MVPYPHRKKHLVVLGGPSEEAQARALLFIFKERHEGGGVVWWPRHPTVPCNRRALFQLVPGLQGAFSPLFANKTSPVDRGRCGAFPWLEPSGSAPAWGRGTRALLGGDFPAQWWGI